MIEDAEFMMLGFSSKTKEKQKRKEKVKKKSKVPQIKKNSCVIQFKVAYGETLPYRS